MVIFSRDRMVDVASDAIDTLVIQYVLKLPQKLAENAMMGGLDDWIASTLGLSWAAFFAFIAEWGFSISVATLFVCGVHLVGKRRFERDIKIAAFTQVATATVTGPNPALRKKKLAFPITLVAIFAVGLCVSLIWLFRVYQQTASLAQTISERERAAIVAPFQAQIDGLRKQL